MSTNQSSWIRWFAVSVVVAALVSPVGSSTVRPVNLEEMTTQAAIIFAGRCVASEVVRDGSLGLDVTVATFEATRWIKGDARPRVTLRFLAATPDSRIMGLPGFTTGEELVLFLHGVSDLGLTSPVGLGQGKFEVHVDKHGGKVAINATGNSTLMQGLSPDAMSKIGSAPSVGQATTGIDPTALLDLAARIAQ